MRLITWTFVSALALTATGCTGDIKLDEGVPDPTSCANARTYTSLGGTALELDRPVLVAGSDRVRTKPYAALAAEYARALGLPSVDTKYYASTFGQPPARWYSEPAASANTLYAAFALAYETCNVKTAAGAEYATDPTAETADWECRNFVRAAWQREGSDAEIAACVTYAVDKTTTAGSPTKRWAYTCASVLAGSRFLTF